MTGGGFVAGGKDRDTRLRAAARARPIGRGSRRELDLEQPIAEARASATDGDACSARGGDLEDRFVA